MLERGRGDKVASCRQVCTGVLVRCVQELRCVNLLLQLRCVTGRRVESESGSKKEIVPCVSVRGSGVPACSYTVEMSCTYMASCVAVGQEVSFDKMWHRRH